MHHGHVMISYQWDSQQIALRIRNWLKSRSYSVWMDVTHMHGCVDERMAEAVENASVVLVCMTQAYQKSRNCRKEFEYAVHQDRYIVPVKLEANFEPSSWLGINVARRLYFDLTDEDVFDDRMGDLACEIGARGRRLPHAPSTPLVVAALECRVGFWSEQRVQQWLDAQGLGKVKAGFQESGVDGAILLTLTDEDLERDIGIGSRVLRRRILKDIADLKMQETASPHAKGGAVGGAAVARLPGQRPHGDHNHNHNSDAQSEGEGDGEDQGEGEDQGGNLASPRPLPPLVQVTPPKGSDHADSMSVPTQRNSLGGGEGELSPTLQHGHDDLIAPTLRESELDEIGGQTQVEDNLFGGLLRAQEGEDEEDDWLVQETMVPMDGDCPNGNDENQESPNSLPAPPAPEGSQRAPTNKRSLLGVPDHPAAGGHRQKIRKLTHRSS